MWSKTTCYQLLSCMSPDFTAWQNGHLLRKWSPQLSLFARKTQISKFVFGWYWLFQKTINNVNDGFCIILKKKWMSFLKICELIWRVGEKICFTHCTYSKWVRITIEALSVVGAVQAANVEKISWQQSASVVWYCNLAWRVPFWAHNGSCMTTTPKYRSTGSKTATILALADVRPCCDF